MTNTVKQAINIIESDLNKTKLDLSNLGLIDEDLIYILNIEKYKSYFESLEYLYLDNNSLLNLPKNIFEKLIKLKGLNLDYNNLSTLPKNIFEKLINLEFLYVNNNKLTSLPKDILDNLVNLEDLYLGNNKLSSLPKNIKNKKGLTIYGEAILTKL